MFTRTLSRVFTALFLCCVLFSSLPAQQTPSPSELVSQANALSDLSKLGAYRLKAMVVVGAGKGEAGGVLTVEHDQENTRQELKFNNYHEVGLIQGNTGYLQREPDRELYAPAQVRHFEDLWWAAIPAGGQIGTVSTVKIDDIQALCFTVQLDKSTHIRNCFDPATHLLLSRTGSEDGSTLDVLFLDYQSVEGVYFPKTIRFIDSQRTPLEVRDISVGKANPGSMQFDPPDHVRAFPSCEHMERARVLRRTFPEYPAMAKIAHIQGDTQLLVTVGADGKTRKISPIGGHPLLLQASSDAVKSWEYRPATCPSGPVESEVIVKIEFHL